MSNIPATLHQFSAEWDGKSHLLIQAVPTVLSSPCDAITLCSQSGCRKRISSNYGLRIASFLRSLWSKDRLVTVCGQSRLNWSNKDTRCKDKIRTYGDKCLIEEAEVWGVGTHNSRRENEVRGILWFISVAQDANIPVWLHSDQLNPLNPKREAPPR